MAKIFINMAMSIDGKSVLPGGRWHGHTSKYDRENMDRIRSISDAVLVGSASLRMDDALLYDRRNPGKNRQPSPVIFTLNGDISPGWNVFQKPHPKALIVGSSLVLEKVENLAWPDEIPDTYPWEGWNNLDEFLAFLEEKRGYQNILVEGGPKINFQFFKRNLIDEMYITIVPFIVGGRGSGPISGDFVDSLPSKKLISSKVIGKEIFLHYLF